MAPTNLKHSRSRRRLLDRLTATVDLLCDVADRHDGLIPSVLLLDGSGMPFALPPAIDGQRMHDRSFPGANLMHDHPLLRMMLDLAEPLDKPAWRDAAERYLRIFAAQCTHTPTGLFPWGEHAFWNLSDWQVGNSTLLRQWHQRATHDHLHAAPPWLWERLWAHRPACVERFAEGLERHWIDDAHSEYCRHAYITGRDRYGSDGDRAYDFPRYGGFYVVDWAFAWTRTGRELFRQYLVEMADYWWRRRGADDLLTLCTRRPGYDDVHAMPRHFTHTLSLAASLYEAAGILADRDAALAATLRDRGWTYARAALAMGHDLTEGRLVRIEPVRAGDEVQLGSVWGSRYGQPPIAAEALTVLMIYRETGESSLLDFARRIGELYLRAPMPDAAVLPHLPIRDAGLTLELFCDLGELDRAERWRDAAMALSEQAVERFMDSALPRAASGLDYYESQLDPSRLLHALARAALMDEQGTTPVRPDYSYR